MLDSLLENGLLFMPWPTTINGVFYNGQLVSISSICKKCEKEKCKELDSGNNEGVCSHGFFYKSNEIDGHYILVHGVIIEKNKLPKYPGLREALKKLYVEKREIIDWFSRIRSLHSHINERDSKIVSKSLHPFHDTNRLAREIRNMAEEYISRNGTGTFIDRLKNSHSDIKTIYKASVLLLDTFDSANIYFNPVSAKYGRPKSIEIYKLIDKLVYILNMSQLQTNKIKILFYGNCNRSYNLYESFKLILLSLLQNAIKYTSENSVKINIEEIGPNNVITVESVGPLIEEEETEIIFSKEKRGKWAQKMTNEGLGVGLFIADMVGIAHGIKIMCSSTPLGFNRNDIPQACNQFYFSLPAIGEIL